MNTLPINRAECRNCGGDGFLSVSPTATRAPAICPSCGGLGHVARNEVARARQFRQEALEREAKRRIERDFPDGFFPGRCALARCLKPRSQHKGLGHEFVES